MNARDDLLPRYRPGGRGGHVPLDQDGFECESAHGGALELLQNHPLPGVERVV